ncbi:MAG: preprotein translocase subunit SecE [Thermoleophilaceae bacterium]
MSDADGPPDVTPASAGSPDARTSAEVEELADLEVGAPPHDLGRSDTAARHSQDAFENGAGDDGGAGTAHAGALPASGGRRGRLIAFLIAVWAELRRVQWPDRKQLTQLTGVVLFFVVIVGAYLGGLDAIFSKIIQAIL